MLVPAMNRHEITAEVVRDSKKLFETTYLRLLKEYDRERKKLRIAKTEAYCKAYPIRTAAKNNWIVFIEKSPSAVCYKSLADAVCGCVLCHHSKNGLEVYRQLGEGFAIEMYYAHLFARYNERMHLNLSNTTDIIKTFFSNNGYTNADPIEKDGITHSYGVCKEGILLGVFKSDPMWLVHKTFISKDLKREDQDAKEREIMLDLQIDVVSKTRHFVQGITRKEIANTDAIYKQISGSNVAATKDKLHFDIPNINMPFKYPPVYL